LAKNRILRAKTLEDIDRRVERVLRDLSDPEPPLDLRQVRELLKLDRAYYTADDPSLAHMVASRIRVGAIQVFKRPALLLDIVRTLDLRGFYVPDQRRILIDRLQPEPKHRWLEAHEIGHSLLPWHEDAMFGDSQHTLSPSCHDAIEAEASFAAGRLLFLRDRFTIQANDHAPGLEAVKALKPAFGNTYTTTFWRCIETWGVERPIVGLITKHPHPTKRAADFNPLKPCRHFIQSPAFAARFTRITEVGLFQVIADYCSPARGGSLGQRECILTDDNGEEHRFHFETFSFYHDVLTLGLHLGPYNTPVKIGVINTGT